MKKEKELGYYLKAYCPRRKEWFTWTGWKMKELKPLADREGLTRLQKVASKITQRKKYGRISQNTNNF